MAKTRLMLQNDLEELMASFDESYRKKHVYYNPPSKGLNYPCILYNLARPRVQYANNHKYFTANQYTVTVIDTNADSPIKWAVNELPCCTLDREFTTDGLTHTVFTLYY